MFFCPADHFDPGDKGGWLISRDDYRALPQCIKCLIEEMESRTIKTKDGTTNTLWVRFVSKGQAMTLAAKHQLGDKVNLHQVVNIDWDTLCTSLPDTVPDLVEERITALGNS